MEGIKETEQAKLKYYSPEINDKAISIIQQEDGNWKGYTQKFGKLIEVRDVGPDAVLQRLLTHDGK
jgi:hypothetical protein